MSEKPERMVTIFGGAKCREGDHEYTQAIEVGALLAESGFTICTGGYAGVMEAASRGAHERGGMGTVTEVSLVWNKLQTHVLDPRPIVLLGDCWPPLMKELQRHLAVSDDELRLLDFAATPEEAVAIIEQKSSAVVVRVEG